MLQLLEDEHTGAFAHDEARTADVEGQGSGVRIFGGGEGLHIGEARGGQRVDGRLRAAGHHRVGIAVANEAERFADGVCAGGARL